MLYGFYSYVSRGKRAMAIFQFDPADGVKRVKEDDQYTYEVRTKKILFDHNTGAKFRNMPRTFNMTGHQLESHSSNDINDIVKIVMKYIFMKHSMGTL